MTESSQYNAPFSRKRRFRKLGILSFALLLTAIPSTAALSELQDEAVLPAGTYRLEMIMATITRLPFFGSSKSASKSVSLVAIQRDESGLMQTHRVCDFRVLEDSRMVKMIFPEKFVAALATHRYPITVEKDGQGWRYRADLGLERIGYRDEGSDGQIPSRIDDPSVYDWDGDGSPGATLKISVPLLPEGELYVVQRGHSLLDGRIVQPGKVEGVIEVRAFEQRVLGAKPSFLNRSPQIDPDPKESRFSMTLVPKGSTCDSLRNAPQAGKTP
ncbi:MAG TPA: hypothetical protein VIB79_04390 [Candidatus Binatia bacterium]